MLSVSYKQTVHGCLNSSNGSQGSSLRISKEGGGGGGEQLLHFNVIIVNDRI